MFMESLPKSKLAYFNFHQNQGLSGSEVGQEVHLSPFQGTMTSVQPLIFLAS